MFYNCSSLTSLNVTNFNINNIYNMQKMFYGCNSLKYTNISNFIFTQNISLFYGLPDYCEIIINKKSLNKINTIPKTCKIFVEDDRSFIVYNSTSNGYSIICKDEYELYKGKCITYTFYAKYHIDYYYEKIKLFNKDKINDIFNMKIDNTNIEPINEYNNFNNIQDYIVYYYMEENISISLSNMFENCNKLIDFSFNNKHIDNYIITDLKGMFNGCISLTSISIYLSNGKNINDISYLFSNCIDLISVNITILNSNNIKYMNNLFNNCTSLININMKFLNYSNFSNSENLRILESENYYFSTINLVDMSNMFYNCISLIILDISKFNTKNVINMSNMFFN